MSEIAAQKVNSYWNSPLCLAEYDKNHAECIGAERDDAVWREEFKRYLPPAPAAVADIGCGTGFASLLLAELGYTVTGLDQAETMLASAREKAAQRKADIRFVQGDAMHPLLPAGSFDVVLSRWVYWTRPDPEAAARNALNLLRPGGMLAVFDGQWFKGKSHTKDDAAKHTPANERDKLWADAYTDELQSQLPLMRENPPEKVAAMLERAGYVNVTFELMGHANAIYHQYKGAERHAQDCLYVVRGYAPERSACNK